MAGKARLRVAAATAALIAVAGLCPSQIASAGGSGPAPALGAVKGNQVGHVSRAPDADTRSVATHPGSSIPPSPDFRLSCGVPLDSSSACTSKVIQATNNARAKEGLGPIHLPANLSSLSYAAQFLVIVNQERGDRGLGPLWGTVASLNSAATTAAANQVPPTIDGIAGYSAAYSWASEHGIGFPNPLALNYAQMYADGTGGMNEGCTTGSEAACWAHRALILDTWTFYPTLGFGEATVTSGGQSRASWSALVVDDYALSTRALQVRWADLLPGIAGPPVVTSVTGNGGGAAGGQTVTITGRNLVEVTSVAFGSTTGGGLRVYPSGTKLTVVSPGVSKPGNVTITLRSTGGNVSAGTFAYTASVPLRPQNTWVTPLGSGFVLVSWIPSGDGGSKLTGFDISGGCPDRIEHLALPGQTSVLLGGLTPGWKCGFSVDQRNTLGSSAYITTNQITVASTRTQTQGFLWAAYSDFLGRMPAAQEFLLNEGAAGSSAARARVVSSLASSTEWVTTIVQKLYQDTLGRPGDPGGVTYWVNKIRTGKVSVAGAAASFYASSEYYTRAGGTDDAWVARLYQALLGRTPDAGGKAYWVGQTAAKGRVNVAGRLFQSPESARSRVRGLYQRLLGRNPDSAGLAYWAGKVVHTGDVALAANLASSSEYLTRAQKRNLPAGKLAPIGGEPLGDVVIDDQGAFAYATNRVTDKVEVISMASAAKVASIPVGDTPVGLDLSADGKSLYVANSVGRTISVVDVPTRTVRSTIPIPVRGAQHDDAISIAVANNDIALVSADVEESSGVSLYRLDLASETLRYYGAVSGPIVLQADAGRDRIAGAASYGNNGFVYDAATDTIGEQVPLDWKYDNRTLGVAIDASGKTLLFGGRLVYRNDFTPIASSKLQRFALPAAALSPDGGTGWALEEGKLSSFDTASGDVTGSIPLVDSIARPDFDHRNNGKVVITRDGSTAVVITAKGLVIVPLPAAG
jgi:YVTN family beta-propeller protein